MTKYAIEPVSFCTGMAAVFLGISLAQDPNFVWQMTPTETFSIGAGIGFAGWIVVLLSVAIGTSHATRAEKRRSAET